jgi:hypothetical protein
MNRFNPLWPRPRVENPLLHLFPGILFALLSQLLPIAAQGTEPKPAPAQQTRFRFEAASDKSMGLWEGDRPVLVYNHGEISKPSVPATQSHCSYVHPLYGLDGEVLTDDFPKDHDYHRGLYWAWPHIKIGEQEHDLWSLRGIQLKFRRWLAQEIKPDMAVLGVENGWFAGDKQVMKETVWVQVHPASSRSRAMDIELTWTPIDQRITLCGAEGKSYGGLTLRFGPRSKTIITVPAGRTSEDLLVTKLPWADFSGDFNKETGGLSGAAVFVQPRHPDYPPTWMTRHYGLLAVGWPGVTPQTVSTGKSITCPYRLWVHRGAPEAREIQKAYEAYCASTKNRGRLSSYSAP